MDSAGDKPAVSPVDPFGDRARERVPELADDLDLGTFAAAFELFRLSTRVINDFETMVHRPLGLSIAGFRVLFTVWVFDEMEPRDIARLSGVTRAAVSGVVNTLERDGLVEKTREQADKRLVTVRLTEGGERLLQEAYAAQNSREQEVFAGLSRDELSTLTQLMRRVTAAQRPER